MPADPHPYDALLLLSFGGPEKTEDVLPFLRNVTKGKDIPDARLEEVGEHYYSFGGKSPINDQNRALLSAIKEDFAQAGIDLPIYWGNRNWDPYLTDALAQMKRDGIERALVFTTSAYSSYSGCRQYRENLADAVAELADGPELDLVRLYFNHPGYVEPVTDATAAAIEVATVKGSCVDAADTPEVSHDLHPDGLPYVLFVTHSIPVGMNASSGPTGGHYQAQHEALMATVMGQQQAQTAGHELVYCSRSGPPQVPWLVPDINDRMEELAQAGQRSFVAVPFGFVSDHMEVIYDLDTEAAETAQQLGVSYVRAATVGTDYRFVALIRDLLLERAAVERGETVSRTVAFAEPARDVCAANCCANPRGQRPALCGSD